MLIATCLIFPAYSKDESKFIHVDIYARDAKEHTQDDTIKLIFNADEGTSKQNDKFGYNILTWYPSFAAPREAQTSQYALKCTGYCDGQILIHLSVENTFRQLGNRSYAQLFYSGFEKLYSARQKKSRLELLNFTSRPSNYQEGFIEKVFSKDGLTPGEENSSTVTITEMLLHVGSTVNDKDMAVMCMLHEAYPGCQIVFSPNCADNLVIKASLLPYSNLEDYINIRNKIESFIAHHIQDTACIGNN